MIAITGATGALGSRVARLLDDDGHRLRLLARDPSRLSPLRHGEAARFDGYLDRAGLRSGLAGCDTLFLVSGRESADRVHEHQTVVDVAAEQGVSKIVYTSFQGAAPDATFTFARDHWHTEQHITATGLTHVYLRDCFYLSALAGFAGADGVIRGPAGNGRVAGVSHTDVAAVAARALVDGAWDNQTLDVTGPESLTLEEVAATLAAVSGRPVEYVAETEQQAYASRAHYDAPDFEIRGWVTTYQAIANGEVAPASDTVRRVTGRSPQRFADFLAAEPTSWAHLVPSTSQPS